MKIAQCRELLAAECAPNVIHVEMLMYDPDPPTMSAPSQLFTVRVWLESRQDESTQVRVQVKHVLSGATRTFREWSQVVAFITAKLQGSEADPTAKGDQR